MVSRCSAIALPLLFCLASTAWCDGWGSIKGRIVYDGKAPTREKVTVTKDVAFCGRFDLRENSLIVGENGGIENVLVGIYLGRRDDPPQVHPDLEAKKSEPVEFDNTKCRFVPHIQVLRAGQTLLIGNDDAVGHNTKVDTFANDPINPIIPAGGQLEQVFELPERLPAPVSCSIHPWMTGWLVIRDDPYAAVTDSEGTFTLEKVPAGTWTFQFWHEKAGFLSEVKRNGEAEEWERGRIEVTIENGKTTDLGEIRVPSSLFE